MKFYHIEKEDISPRKWSHIITVFNEIALFFFEGGGMPERVKKMKCGRGGARTIWRWGYAGKGTEEKMQGGVAEKKWGGMPERVKKTKCGGGVARKIWGGGGLPERVKKMKCGGVAGKNLWGGGLNHTKKWGGWSVENYVFFRGSNIKWDGPM